MTNDQALSPRLWPHPFAWHNFVDVFTTAPIWRWALNTLEYSVLATLGVLALERPRRLCARAPALARPQRRVHDRADRADAAAAGVGRAAVRHVGEAAPRRHALAGDHPELVRRRVLDLPAAPVLHDDSRGVPRRRARRRSRRAARPQHRRRAPRQAGDRRRRALLVPLHVQRLLPAAPLHRREPAPLGAADRALRVPLAAPGAVEPDDGRDAARHGAGDRAVLPRAEGLRRGRHADGGEGMKLAVIGAGSTYTPELVSHLSQLDVDEVALHDIDAERLEVVGGLARRMLDRAGLRRRAPADRRPRRCDRRRVVRALPDPRRRAGGAAARRDGAAALRLHRPGDDRRRRLREGDAHGAGDPRARGARRRARRAGRLDRRLHEPGGDRDARAARRRPPRRRALQRRDHLPATVRAAARRRARARARRPGRAEPPDVDSRGAARRPRRAPRAARRAWRRARRRDRASAQRARRPRRDPVLLPALLLRARPRARGAAGRGAARADRRRDRARAAADVPRSEPDGEAGAARAARRRASTARPRSGSFARSLRATAPCTSSTRGTAGRSPASRTTTSSRCRRA